MSTRKAFDIFISYASEDKTEVVDPLMREFVSQGMFHLWIDEVAIQLAESIRAAIDRGINESRYMLVVLSPSYFQKHWTGLEFDAAITMERQIFPVWHGVSSSEVKKFSPMIAGIKGIRFENPCNVVQQILDVLARDKRSMYARSAPDRAEKNAFWIGARVFIDSCLSTHPESLFAAFQSAGDIVRKTFPDYEEFVQHYERELGSTREKIVDLRTAFPMLEDEEATIAILEIHKDLVREDAWCPPTPGRDAVLAKINGDG